MFPQYWTHVDAVGPELGRESVLQANLPMHYLYLYVTWQYALLCYRATGAIAPHCGFSGVSPDGNCAYVHCVSFTSNSSSVRRAIWFTWFSEPHLVLVLAVPGGHPSNYRPGPALLNFIDRANTNELTQYSVYDFTLTLRHQLALTAFMCPGIGCMGRGTLGYKVLHTADCFVYMAITTRKKVV